MCMDEACMGEGKELSEYAVRGDREEGAQWGASVRVPQCPASLLPLPLQVWSCVARFGGVQLLVSQVPSLESAWWSSLLGSAMSLLYSGIAVGLGLAHGGAAGRGGAMATGGDGDGICGGLNTPGSVGWSRRGMGGHWPG